MQSRHLMTRTMTNSMSLISTFSASTWPMANLHRSLISRWWARARKAPQGKVISVAYNALRPGTKSGAVPKVSFVARIGKQGCGVGYYRQKLQPSQSDKLPPSREAIRSGLIIEALDVHGGDYVWRTKAMNAFTNGAAPTVAECYAD